MKLPDKKQLIALVKKNKYLLIIGAIGLFLILLPVGGSKETPAAQGSLQASGEYEFDLAAYEKRLEDALSGVQSVGRVKVMLYLRSGTETVYATEGSSSGRSELENSESFKLAIAGGEPVIVKRLYPEFGGAVIVCDGGSSPVVAYEVTKAVSSVTGLKSDKITVLPMRAK